MTALRLAHLADTHLGYEALAVLDPTGQNQRGVDTVAAFAEAVDAIIAWDPPLVVHAGDMAEKPQVAVRYELEARRQLARLASLRPDGTRRQVVVIAGNHDAPRDKRDACWLELCADLPGVHVVTDRPRRIGGPDLLSAGGADELADVEVWAVPHDALRDRDSLAAVVPTSGTTSLLVTHGVASGSPLFLRHIGREHAIPVELVDQDWDYVALGHWHTHGPVDGDARVQYSGSTETFGFGDLRDGGNRRGWSAVTVDGDAIAVEHRAVSSRRFVKLGPVDGTGLDGDELTAAARAALDGTDLTGAVATLVVTGASRSAWSLVDQQDLRARAAGALHFEIVARLAAEPTVTVPRSEGALDEVLAQAAVVVAARRRSAAVDAARNYLWGRGPDGPASGEADGHGIDGDPAEGAAVNDGNEVAA